MTNPIPAGRPVLPQADFPPGTYRLIKRVVVDESGHARFVDEPGGVSVAGVWPATLSVVEPVPAVSVSPVDKGLRREVDEIRAALVAADPKADLPGHAYVSSVDIVRHLVAERDAYFANWERARAALASRSTPALPDGAEEQIAQCLADYWIDLRGGRVPFEETDAGQAREVVALVRSWLPSPATDPEPATPDRLVRERAELERLVLYLLAKLGGQVELTEEELTAGPPGTGFAWSETSPGFGRKLKLIGRPVAPQAPAEPTASARLFNRLIAGASVVNGVPQTPAGPAVPEDTATPDDVNPVADVLAARDAVLNAPPRWGADNPGLIPPDDYGDDPGGWDSHRADTTRPAGEES